MFGQNNQHKQDDGQIPEQSIDGVITADNSTQGSSGGQDWQHPGLPPSDDAHTDDNPPAHHDTVITPVDTSPLESQAVTPSAPVADTPLADDASISADDTTTITPATHPNDLIDIKRQALGQLSPLVGHLDQTPEEKFRTTMMMIQASDDQSLIKTAYDAAKKIEDEKTRAQALLDVINEINYFTTQQNAKS